jgi:prepilin-type processing-associated H-X9-DG protein
MELDLLGYLMKSVGPREQAAVEAYLVAHPAAAARAESLRKTLDWLSLDPSTPPPPGLADDTLARIIPKIDQSPEKLPKEGPKPLPWRPGRRLIEAAVAATVVLVGLGGVATWVASVSSQHSSGSPSRAQTTECQDNLRKLYGALSVYADTHRKQFPNVATGADSPRNVAGLVFSMLLDGGVLPPDAKLSCAGAMGPVPCVISVQDVRSLSGPTWQGWADGMRHSYAYSLGYRVKSQILPTYIDDEVSSYMPLMSDSSPIDPTSNANSPSHGGSGQNVLFCDGHVVFSPLRTIGFDRDDIFLNHSGKAAAGLDARDGVLASGPILP